MESKNNVFDVLVAGKKVGEAFDVNPVVINDDFTCKECLLNLKEDLPLTETEVELIDKCINVVSSKDDDDVVFGPEEVCDLGDLAQSYPSHMNEILACSHHITESIDFDGEIPFGIYGVLASSYAELGNVLEAAMKIGNIENIKDFSQFEDFEDCEEIISDDEFQE